MSEKLLISPKTKIGELLDAYPALESVLMEVAPAFNKLKNPILRKTVAKVTTVAQAARIGELPVTEFVQRLRREVGQPDFRDSDQDGTSERHRTDPPGWFDESAVVETFDARPEIDAGKQPMGQVLRDLDKLEDGQIYAVIAPFEPAPLIDKATARGFVSYTVSVGASEKRTYFTRGKYHGSG